MSGTSASSAPDIEGAAKVLGEALSESPTVMVVLGSGLGHLAERVENPTEVEFGELPGFPASTVPGHAGWFVGGTLSGCPVLLQSGRYHVYEGHPMDVVVAPVRVAAALGVGTLVVTNAAGGADPDLAPGTVVLIRDHLNLMFRSPLIGKVRPGEPRFPDMTSAYDPELRRLAAEVASELGIPLSEGVYAALTGPSYETPAEVRMLRTLGADMIGMSTVPEVIAARSAGLRCLGFSMVTNKGAGYTDQSLGHDEVIEVGRRAGASLASLIEGVFGRLATPGPGPRSD